MIPHCLSIALILLATAPANSANAPGPTQKHIAEKKTARTWKAVADYIFKNGIANVIPIDLLLGITLVETIPEGRKIDGFGIRITPDGRIVWAMRAIGIVGEVEQKALSADSAEVKRVYKAESILHLKTIKLEQLTQ